MPDPARPPEDVNERVKIEWKHDTSTFDRVKSVMHTAYEPMSTATVARKALTEEEITRKHLRSLAEFGYVTETVSTDSKDTLYRRATDSLALEQARRILDEMDTDTLSMRVLNMRKELREYGNRFGTNSPEEAVKANASIEEETLQMWQTTRRNLAFAEIALALGDVSDVGGIPERI